MLTYTPKSCKYGLMKTTLVIPDPLFRRVKARAAMKGMPLRAFMEESLEQALRIQDESDVTVNGWIDRLPKVPAIAVREVNSVISDPTFRSIEQDMWS